MVLLKNYKPKEENIIKLKVFLAKLKDKDKK